MYRELAMQIFPKGKFPTDCSCCRRYETLDEKDCIRIINDHALYVLLHQHDLIPLYLHVEF